MKSLRLIGAIVSMNLRNIPGRLGASLVVVIGIGATVGVVISVLAMSSSLLAAANGEGRSDRVIVLHSGAVSEAASGLSREDAALIEEAPGVRKGNDGRSIVSAEIVRQVPLLSRAGKANRDFVLRGVGSKAFDLRPEIHVIEGRAFGSGLKEIILGAEAQKMLGGLKAGEHIRFSGDDWSVVGVFASGSKSRDMELLADAEVVMSAFSTNQFSSVTALLDSPDALSRLAGALSGNPAVSVDAQIERDYYVRQSQSLAVILRVVAYIVGSVMGLGASFGALNAMYTMVAARSWEIATFRAMGFGAGVVLMSILVEALVLGIAGAFLAGGVSWLLFDNMQIAQGNGSGGSVVYSLSFTPRLALSGAIWACVLGLIGALPPALRAARLPVATALRTLR